MTILTQVPEPGIPAQIFRSDGKMVLLIISDIADIEPSLLAEPMQAPRIVLVVLVFLFWAGFEVVDLVCLSM